MGNCNINIQLVGCHHNTNNPTDANLMARKFVQELQDAGHCVTSATFTSGCAESVIPSVPTSQIEGKAAELYSQYCQSVGGKAFNGDPLPDWCTFAADPAKQKQADAWREVARQTIQSL